MGVRGGRQPGDRGQGWLAGIAPEFGSAELRERVDRARRGVAAAEARLLANPGVWISLDEYTSAAAAWRNAKAVLAEWFA